MIPFSVLDLAPIADGSTLAETFDNSVKLAKRAEQHGFNRVWYAEHHGMNGVASSATSLVMAHIAAATESIRVGSGGIMLPNHAPLIIAEQFGTLEALYPGRIDLGLGRAPGTDMKTSRALRRNMNTDVDDYPSDVLELQQYLSAPVDAQLIKAIPGSNANVPIWLLGSSLYSAQLAAQMGLPFSFASHFAPELLFDAIRIYQSHFTPSIQCEKPYIMLGVMAVLADTDQQAEFLFTSVQQQFLNLAKGQNKAFAAPVEGFSAACSERDKAMLAHTLRYAVVGDSSTALEKLAEFINSTECDELIVSLPIHDIQARLDCLDLLAQSTNMLKQG